MESIVKTRFFFKSQNKRAEDIVKRNLAWAAGGGLIAIPLVDIAVVVTAQVKMVRELCAVYNVPFSNKIVRATLVSTISGFGSSFLAYGGFGSLAVSSLTKIVPVIGTILGATTMSVFASALTFAVGKYFIRHFESGGTLEDVNKEKASEEIKNIVEEYVNKDNVPSKENQKANKNGLFYVFLCIMAICALAYLYLYLVTPSM